DGTFRKQWDLNVASKYRTLLAYVGNSAPDIAPWRANIVTNYTFQNGFLKNVNVGAGYRWEDKKILGYGLSLNPETGTLTPDASKPLKGDTTDHVDLWVGYSRKLTDKIDWRIQLNLRNVGENHHLEAASLNPDGAVALARIVEGTTWQLSNTFSF
ncbi:MAG: TonB-dependent receptor, partial [Opitutaceae bacterium]|nr:TonB-dependent receptor [Opitutaceae bacterium]